MQVFISWSGTRSKQLARAVSTWVRAAVHASRPWLSEIDIEKGERWNVAVSNRLEESRIGIVCLTPENLTAPWIHFEAGALAKAGNSRVCVILFEVEPNNVPDTLAQFQHTKISEEDLAQLAVTINRVAERAGEPVAPDDVIRKASMAAWPELQAQVQQLAKLPMQKTFVIGGKERYEGTMHSIAPETLDRFHSSAKKQLDFIGHSLTGLFETTSGRNSIMRALINGATVRVVFLDPTTPHSNQLAQVSRAIKTDLINKINRSIDNAINFKDALRPQLRRLNPGIKETEVLEAQGRLQLAVSGLISYAHIQRADDTILVSHYSQSDEPGLMAPTQELVAGDRFFPFYEEEFNRFWRDATPVEEFRAAHGLLADRARVVHHLPTIRSIHRSVVSGGELEPLPPPKMFVVLPNMACSIKCPSCFTWNSDRMKGQHMSEELFTSILTQASSVGASCVELSGGGEPLEHPKAARFLNIATSFKANNPSLRIGVLSNANFMPGKKSEELLSALMGLDYIRLGWTEHYDREHEKYLTRFLNIIRTMGERRAKVDSSLRIGVKLLLTSNNVGDLISTISTLLNTRLKSGQTIVDHIKVKSIRGDAEIEPSPDQIRDFEQAMVALKAHLGMQAQDIQVDVKSARVDTSYKCWISPLMTVVDAAGSVYLCCNFYERPDASKIGDLGVKGEVNFLDFWGKGRHRTVIRDMHAESVCNSPFGSHCRMVHYQKVIEPYLPYTQANSLAPEDFFPGHKSLL